MASDKIINSILESANKEADEILSNANLQATEEKNKIKLQGEERLANLKKQFEEDSKNIEKHAKLNAGIQERKNRLETRRHVMDLAFDEAKRKLELLPEETWVKLITKIVLEGTDTDTEYIKVTKKDYDRFAKPYKGNKSLLDILNEKLSERGHKRPLKLDKDPAHFKDGIMLIGKYSDVNASFDVLLENQKEFLEYDVTNILFDSEE